MPLLPQRETPDTHRRLPRHIAVDAVTIIKEVVDIRRCCEHYGLVFDTRSMAHCPFHDDRHPSASIKNGRFHCYVCDLHLDVFAFVMQLYNCGFRDALRRINADFGLRLNLDKPADSAEVRRAIAQRRKKQEDLERYREIYEQHTMIYKAIRDLPVPQPGEDAGLYARLLGVQEYLDYWFSENHWR